MTDHQTSTSYPEETSKGKENGQPEKVLRKLKGLALNKILTNETSHYQEIIKNNISCTQQNVY